MEDNKETNDKDLFYNIMEEEDLEIVDPTYSFGTDPAIISIIKLINQNSVDCVCINIWTLIRNVFNKDTKIDENLNKLINNIDMLLSNLSFVYGSNSNIKNPFIYFYMYRYDSLIPTLYLRETNSQIKKLLKEVSSQYYKYSMTTQKTELKTFKYDNLNVIIDLTQKINSVSYVLMNGVISSIPNKHKVALLTHIPLDAHIFKNFDTVVVRSHSGEVCDQKRYGEIVFGINVPFIKELHVLLGDKEIIKGVFHHKTKKELIDRATNAKWHMWSSVKIRSEISNLYKLPYNLP